ncbi:acyltransferase [Desulfovibrio aerotolerans]|uniref:Acyltransferase n=1 Tax=Solidesulfovibrio aerotolerans TaxID=295255 RepID=A0A7C9JAX3_9BACT|nr:acyltransferase [Solidesulfovibrio aerotolerans]MYL84638.1 acyltransferase [Solidesulfovibrio aerotolerans]
MSISFLYEEGELQALGFAAIGKNVSIDRSVRFFGIGNISIGDNVRIDPFCLLSAGPGGISIGRNVHLGVSCSLIGRARIELHDFAGLSGKTSIYSSTDDYLSGAMTNPTVPEEFTNVVSKPVIVYRHAVVGTGSVLLPGVTVGQGAAIGALSLVRKNVEEYAILLGNPAKKIGQRGRTFLDHEIVLRRWEEGKDPT